MKKKENTKSLRKRSIFGLVSLIFGLINVGLILIFAYRFGMWVVENEIYNNPRLLEGKRIPENIESLISYMVVMVIIGFTFGIVGLIEKKRKLASIIGTILNGLLLLICMFKLYL